MRTGLARAYATAAALAAALLAPAVAGAQIAYPDIGTVKIAVGDDVLGASPALDDSGWDEISPRLIDPQGRLLWVRAHVTIPKVAAFEASPLAVYVSALAAYEVYWNGARIGGSGTPGTNAALELPGRLDTSHYVPPRLIREGENLLALKMSSFHLRRTLASPVHFLGLGEYGAGRAWLTGRLPVVAAAGALLLGAVYFAAMFLSDRRDRGSLLLSLLSLGVLIQLGIELSRAVWSYPYPLHILRLEAVHLTAIVAGLVLVAYVIDRYAARHRRVLLGVTILGMTAATLIPPGFDAKTAFAILSALLAVIVAAAIGARARISGAALTGIVAAGLVVWFTMEPVSFVDETYYLAVTAFLLFLFGQQVVTLRRAESVRAAAEVRSARIELELLKRQIQPHFLMNALTAVSEWIESDPQTGVRMIEALANEFRALVAMSGKTLVPLAEELELCRQHLKVMSYRRQCAFTLASEGVKEAERVPPAIFHTLLENALTHNAYKYGAAFRLEAGTSARGRRVYRLRSPREERARTHNGEGKGQAYVRARLQEAFGEEWSFAAGPAGGEWVDTIEVPRA